MSVVDFVLDVLSAAIWWIGLATTLVAVMAFVIFQTHYRFDERE